MAELSQEAYAQIGRGRRMEMLYELLFRLFTAIAVIHQLASTASRKVLPLGLTSVPFMVLNHCVRTVDNKTPAQLADILRVTRATLTCTLGRLLG
jgi:hypothetical protein